MNKHYKTKSYICLATDFEMDTKYPEEIFKPIKRSNFKYSVSFACEGGCDELLDLFGFEMPDFDYKMFLGVG